MKDRDFDFENSDFDFENYDFDFENYAQLCTSYGSCSVVRYQCRYTWISKRYDALNTDKKTTTWYSLNGPF